MTEQQAKDAINAAFIAGFATGAPGVPFALDNETLSTSDTFAALSILTTTSQQATQGATGTRRVMRNGWIMVKLCTPAGQRSGPSDALKAVVRSIFEMTQLGSSIPGDGITTLAADDLPPVIDGRWYQVVTRFPFWFAETK